VDGTTANSTVTISPTTDTVAIARATYTTKTKAWVVAGTSTILAGQTITVHLGLVNGPVVGTALVDPTGAFQVKSSTAPVATIGAQVTAESALGGTSPSLAVKIQ
jgi:hypothetical protein